ncbi:hypothetical protein DIPPA_34820 [Diplonema papillatum]|nr:hypothetical protein DIPPA_34820 [Diplonema papillatum]
MPAVARRHSRHALESMPREVLLVVLSCLDVRDLLSLERVCKAFECALRLYDGVIWKSVYAKSWTPAPPEPIPCTPAASKSATGGGSAPHKAGPFDAAAHFLEHQDATAATDAFSAHCGVDSCACTGYQPCAHLAQRVRRLRLEHVPFHLAASCCASWKREVWYNMAHAGNLRCGLTLNRCHDEVWVVKWSPCGTMLAAGCRGGEYAIYKLQRCGRRWMGSKQEVKLSVYWKATCESGSIAMVDWSPDSKRLLLSTTYDKAICFNVAKRQCIPEAIPCIDFDCYARWYSDTEFLCGHSRSHLLVGAPSSHTLAFYSISTTPAGTDKLSLVRTITVKFSGVNTVHCPAPLVTESGETFAVFVTGGKMTGQCCKVGMAPINEKAQKNCPEVTVVESSNSIELHLPKQADAELLKSPASPTTPMSEASDATTYYTPAAPGSPQFPLSDTLVSETRPPLKQCLGPIIGLAVHPSTEYLLLNLRPYKRSTSQYHYNAVRPISQSPVLQLVSARGGTVVKQFAGHRAFSTDVAPFLSWPSISPFSPHVAVGSEDNLIYIYNLNHEDIVCKLGV